MVEKKFCPPPTYPLKIIVHPGGGFGPCSALRSAEASNVEPLGRAGDSLPQILSPGVPLLKILQLQC